MAIINFLALALALAGPALAHHHHHHNGTGVYYPGIPTRIPTHPPHDGDHFHRTTRTSHHHHRPPTALPSGPHTGIVDDPPFPTQAETVTEIVDITTQVPTIIYPTGTGGLCIGNCSHGNATEYAFAARAAEATVSICDGKPDQQQSHEGQADLESLKHHEAEHPPVVPTEVPVFNNTQGLGNKLPKGFAHISTFLTKGRGVAKATGAVPLRDGY